MTAENNLDKIESLLSWLGGYGGGRTNKGAQSLQSVSTHLSFCLLSKAKLTKSPTEQSDRYCKANYRPFLLSQAYCSQYQHLFRIKFTS
jgi:hypothetical protein